MQRQRENSASGATFRRESLPVVMTRFIHKHFLLILIGAYALSALFPSLGLALRKVKFGNMTWPDGCQTDLSLALLMLSFLLFNAEVAIKIEELIDLGRRPTVPIAGFVTNTLVPIALIVSLLGIMQLWHSSSSSKTYLLDWL
jgi:hypothetical protein